MGARVHVAQIRWHNLFMRKIKPCIQENLLLHSFIHGFLRLNAVNYFCKKAPS